MSHPPPRCRSCTYFFREFLPRWPVAELDELLALEELDELLALAELDELLELVDCAGGTCSALELDPPDESAGTARTEDPLVSGGCVDAASSIAR